MTAPAAAAAAAPLVPPAPRAAPQPASDRFAFAAVLDSLPGAAAKAGAFTAEEGSGTSNEPSRGQSPRGQPGGYPMPGDGAFLSSLPFALPSALATDETAGAAVDAPPSMKGVRLETSDTSNAAEPAAPAVVLTGERAFHFAASASGGVVGSAAKQLPADAPSFGPAAAAGESGSGALGSSAVAPLSMRGRELTRDAPSSGVGAGLSPAEGGPAASPAPSTIKAPAVARGAGAPANPPASAMPAAAQDPTPGERKAASAASPSVARVASPAAAAAKAEPGDRADGRPPDPMAQVQQSAPQASAFGAPLAPSAAGGPSFGLHDGPTATAAVAAPASAPALAQGSAAPPVKEIELDLAPGGLEDVSMTMRLAGDRLSVVIRAASSQTAGSIEGARDAIADRLAAIGQPLDSLIVRQTGGSADAIANGNAASADDGSTGGGRQSGQGAGAEGGSGSSRRGAARDRGF